VKTQAHPIPERARSTLLSACVCAWATLAQNAYAQETDKLVELINRYRSSPQQCEGERAQAGGPLAPHARLARVEVGSSSGTLSNELRRVGYPAARSQFVVLGGPQSAQAAMSLLTKRYCKVLTSGGFADIGVSRQGTTWRIVFAQPLLSPDLGDWRAAGKSVLELVNAARSEPRTCGNRRFQPAEPLTWESKLAATAHAHSRDMANRDYFAHRGRGGSQVGERALRHGYEWRRIGENIATGQGSPEQVVASWLASPRHCANIMESGFSEMGAAFAVNSDSRTIIYWTQVLAKPRP
jgi:uncharacterized protein YkwD